MGISPSGDNEKAVACILVSNVRKVPKAAVSMWSSIQLDNVKMSRNIFTGNMYSSI